MKRWKLRMTPNTAALFEERIAAPACADTAPALNKLGALIRTSEHRNASEYQLKLPIALEHRDELLLLADRLDEENVVDSLKPTRIPLHVRV